MINPLFIKRGKSRAINAENLTGEKGKGGMASSHLGKSRKGSPCLVDIASGKEVILADIQGAGVISHFWMTVDQKTSDAERFVLRDLVLKFFYQIDYILYDEMPAETEYFHAQWRRQAITEKGNDYIIADGVKGCGRYVGTYIALSTLERYWWGEGEVKFYIDGDEEYPTICGTGMEDYFGGSWSFAGYPDGKMQEQCYSTAYLGYPFYSRHDQTIVHPYHNDDCPPMRGFYRWHMWDPIFFEEDLKVTLQQIGVSYRGLFERQDDLSSVAYWYQKEPHHPFPKLPECEERWPR